MKRAEILQQIKQCFHDSMSDYNNIPGQTFFDEDLCQDKLTALFIQLSEERCGEQKIICADNYCHYVDVDQYSSRLEDEILNAPFPTLD